MDTSLTESLAIIRVLMLNTDLVENVLEFILWKLEIHWRSMLWIIESGVLHQLRHWGDILCRYVKLKDTMYCYIPTN